MEDYKHILNFGVPKFSDVGNTGHYEDLIGPFTDKCGHWPKKFVSDEPFELILSYEIMVTSPVTIVEFSVCHKNDFTDIMLCRDGIYKIGMYYAECTRPHKEVRKVMRVHKLMRLLALISQQTLSAL